MYRDGFLSKNECVQAKEKILKTSKFSKTNCDNIQVKKNYITKKKSKKPKDSSSGITSNSKDSKYNWYVVVKHPKTNFEFIATKVSNAKDARKIALNKCYTFEKEQLGKLKDTECYVDLIVDANLSLQLAKKILDKQEQQEISQTKVFVEKEKNWKGFRP